jgi:DNA-binding IclR family transcriptional regulator
LSSAVPLLYRMLVILYQSAKCPASLHERGLRMKSVGSRARKSKRMAAKRPPSQIQVIARAAAILRALEHEPEGLSLAQIAQRVKLARSTVQRIVAALAVEKFLVAASPTGRVRLGPGILRLAAATKPDFVAAARPLLVQLSAELKETVDLAVVRGDHMEFVDQVIGSHRLRAVSAIGETFPLHCTANGKAYLAQLDAETITGLIGASYASRTPRTITQFDDLLRDLKAARKTGVAIDREEHTRGICAAGIVTRDPLGNVLAISVPVPAHRFYDHQSDIVARLLATKDALQRQMLAAAA